MISFQFKLDTKALKAPLKVFPVNFHFIVAKCPLGGKTNYCKNHTKHNLRVSIVILRISNFFNHYCEKLFHLKRRFIKNFMRDIELFVLNLKNM